MDIHRLQILIAAVTLVFALWLHYLSPDDDVFIMVVTVVLGFLFGKFTNGFGKKPVPKGEDGQSGASVGGNGAGT